MTWTPPVAVTVAELLAAAKYNTQVKDNLLHVRETHGPIIIPAQDMSDAGVIAMAERGTEPATYEGQAFLNTGSTYRHCQRIVPDNWISGGFTAKLHWAVVDATAGSVKWKLHYIFRSVAESLTATKTALSPAVFAHPGVIDQEIVSNLGTTTAPTAGQMIYMTLERDAADVGDNYAFTALVTALELEYV